MTHSESFARKLVEAAASGICRKADPDRGDRLTPSMVWPEAREATESVLDVLHREHTAGLMPYNPGAYLNELIEKVREVS